jgi:stage V sporulation protein R
LFSEGLLTAEEHGQYNYSNALVKASNRMGMNPYLIGSTMWKEIKHRWDTGRHGMEYENCIDARELENWDTKDMKGTEKLFEVMKTYTDWFFMQDYLTVDMIDKLDLYIYQQVETVASVDYVRTKHTSEQCRDLIVNSFAYSGLPKIEITNGNLDSDGHMIMIHRYTGIPLDSKYCTETLKHIYKIWGRPITLKTWVKDKNDKDVEKFFTEGNGNKKSDTVAENDSGYQLFHLKYHPDADKKIIYL